MKLQHLHSLLSLLAVLFLRSIPLSGSELEIAKVFADHAVLQRGVPVTVWGTAKPGVDVTVDFAGQKNVTTADADGSWKLEITPLKAHATGTQMTVVAGEQRLEIRDVLVGEVWYASGQSNMQMTLASCAKRVRSIGDIVADPKRRLIRTLRLGNPDTETPLSDLPDAVEWQDDTPVNRQNQSAAAFFFARELHDELQVPIGIIEGSWGGKPIEGFIPKSGFKRDPVLTSILELSEANELDKLQQIEGGVIIRNTAGRPGRIFNARVASVAPYAVKGFLWYQGESNAGKGEDPRHYYEKTRALVAGWRNVWNKPGLPFYFVQLPAFNDTAVGWIRLREEQRLSLQIPRTGMAVTIDLRDSDIHPANKVDVGKRLARWALAKSYARPVAFSGPLFLSAEIEVDQIRVNFEYVGEGLMIAGKEGLNAPVEQKDSALAHFELSDGTGQWYPAEAQIDGTTVVVKSLDVRKPIGVRYACQGAPEHANLYNRAGLPASPFCSDLALLPWAEAK